MRDLISVSIKKYDYKEILPAHYSPNSLGERRIDCCNPCATRIGLVKVVKPREESLAPEKTSAEILEALIYEIVEEMVGDAMNNA